MLLRRSSNSTPPRWPVPSEWSTMFLGMGRLPGWNRQVYQKLLGLEIGHRWRSPKKAPARRQGLADGGRGEQQAAPPHSKGIREPSEQPLVEPQVVHFMHVPFRTRVKLPHSPQLSPS